MSTLDDLVAIPAGSLAELQRGGLRGGQVVWQGQGAGNLLAQQQAMANHPHSLGAVLGSNLGQLQGFPPALTIEEEINFAVADWLKDWDA